MFSTSEPSFENQRSLLQRVFGTGIANEIGAREVGLTVSDCPGWPETTYKGRIRTAADYLFVPPHEIRPDAPPVLCKIIQLAMEEDPEHRYQRGNDMQVELCAYTQQTAPGTVATSLANYLDHLFRQDRAREDAEIRTLLEEEV